MTAVFETSVATERLTRQFTNDEYLIPAFVETGMQRIDAIAGITGIVASSFFEHADTRGQEAQGLADWNNELRQKCSERFHQLCGDFPDMSREDINSLDEMILMNGIRRGVKHAMGQSYHFASRRVKPVGFAAISREFTEDSLI